MILRLLTSVIVAGALTSGPLCAAAQKLRVDPAASKVEFVARATMHSVEGRISAWQLELTMPDGAALPDSAVFTGDGLSLTTDHEKRDVEMHHWMEHDRLPTITFRLSGFSGTAPARVAVGTLVIHGVSLPVSFPVTITRDDARLTIAGEAVLDTTKFGLPVFRKFGLLSVDPEVKVKFSVTGTLE